MRNPLHWAHRSKLLTLVSPTNCPLGLSPRVPAGLLPFALLTLGGSFYILGLQLLSSIYLFLSPGSPCRLLFCDF